MFLFIGRRLVLPPGVVWGLVRQGTRTWRTPTLPRSKSRKVRRFWHLTLCSQTTKSVGQTPLNSIVEFDSVVDDSGETWLGSIIFYSGSDWDIPEECQPLVVEKNLYSPYRIKSSRHNQKVHPSSVPVGSVFLGVFPVRFPNSPLDNSSAHTDLEPTDTHLLPSPPTRSWVPEFTGKFPTPETGVTLPRSIRRLIISKHYWPFKWGCRVPFYLNFLFYVCYPSISSESYQVHPLRVHPIVILTSSFLSRVSRNSVSKLFCGFPISLLQDLKRGTCIPTSYRGDYIYSLSHL